jgi:uncharacterized membrane protein YfcA
VSPLEAVLIGFAGLAAGTINTVVGSGTLITFPTLLAFGVPPVTANVSNTVGLVPGSISGAIGYRRELVGQRTRIIRLAAASFLGGLAGAVLLLKLPAEAFEAIVPVLVGLGLLLVVLGPRISGWVAARRETSQAHPAGPTGSAWVWPAILLTGVYGGYFGAAQGVLLMAVMGIGITESLQRLNAVKNVLAAVANAVSGALFVVVADVDWRVAGLIAAGAIVGGQVGARLGRSLRDEVLRGVIVAVGSVALVVFLTR